MGSDSILRYSTATVLDQRIPFLKKKSLVVIIFCNIISGKFYSFFLRLLRDCNLLLTVIFITNVLKHALHFFIKVKIFFSQFATQHTFYFCICFQLSIFSNSVFHSEYCSYLFMYLVINVSKTIRVVLCREFICARLDYCVDSVFCGAPDV